MEEKDQRILKALQGLIVNAARDDYSTVYIDALWATLWAVHGVLESKGDHRDDER
jgi:hypothetical protein